MSSRAQEKRERRELRDGGGPAVDVADGFHVTISIDGEKSLLRIGDRPIDPARAMRLAIDLIGASNTLSLHAENLRELYRARTGLVIPPPSTQKQYAQGLDAGNPSPGSR